MLGSGYIFFFLDRIGAHGGPENYDKVSVLNVCGNE